MTEEPEELTLTVPAAMLDALLEAAEALCLAAGWFPPDDYATPEMIVPTARVIALSAALGPLEIAIAPDPTPQPELPS